MVKALDYLKETPSQTAGPYVHIGTNPNRVDIAGLWSEDLGASMVAPGTRGRRIVITGRIFDGTGKAVRDALVELWQADADGLHNSTEERRGEADPSFRGWGRQPTDPISGEFRFLTIKPGCVPWRDGTSMAPHITVWIVARGINLGLHTRLYFDDEPEANAVDPVLARIDPSRVVTLLAIHSGEESGMPVYRFDVCLQGQAETVFLDV